MGGQGGHVPLLFEVEGIPCILPPPQLHRTDYIYIHHSFCLLVATGSAWKPHITAHHRTSPHINRTSPHITAHHRTSPHINGNSDIEA